MERMQYEVAGYYRVLNPSFAFMRTINRKTIEYFEEMVADQAKTIISPMLHLTERYLKYGLRRNRWTD